jgi:hypothetical protein
MAKLIRHLAALVAPLAFVLAVALPALADTYVVDDIADLIDDNIGDGLCHTAMGTCTLRAAVQEANAHAGADAITLPAGTVVLTQTGFGEDNAVTGDLDITGDLTVTGAGAASTVIDGNAADRVFDIKVVSGHAVGLAALTIRNGDARPSGANGISSGGGIYIDDEATLNLTDVVIAGSHADSGGGINNYYGWLAISGGAILSNTSNYEGGGIGSGGYYYAYGGGGSGPSKEKADKPAPLRVPGPADAGRFETSRGPITQTRSAPRRASRPAAKESVFPANTIILSATTIAENFADGYGGGGVYASGPLTVTVSDILSNTTGNSVGNGDGAGIEVYDRFFISGTRFLSNTALYDNDNDSGGGLAANGYDRGVILNSVFARNSASRGGAIYIARYGADITGTTFHDNFAWRYGGAIYGGLSSYDSLLSLLNTTIDHNTTRGDGGGYYADNGAHLLQNVTLVNNTADVERDNAGDGGGLTIGSNTMVRTRNSVLAGNAITPPETRAVFTNCFAAGSAAVLESLGHNAFGVGPSCPISGLLPSDLIGVEARLASRDAGGTLSPLPGSPLIDAGDGAACPATDQRGVARPQLGGCDIGAVEVATSTVAVLSGYVYGDRGADGVRGPGEPGINGAEVRVTGGAVDQIAETAPDGFWAFLLPAGVYTLTETQPAGYQDGIDTLGSAGGTAGNDVFAGIVLTATQRGEGYLFGEIGTSLLSGRVFVDADENGIWNPAVDSGISGATVTLSGTTRLGSPIELVALTDPNGLYVFPGITAGTYALSETQPAGYVDYTDTVGTGGGVMAGIAPDNDVIASIIVTDNTDIQGYTFGEVVALSLDAMEFVDYDADGAPGYADDRINGITLTLSDGVSLFQSEAAANVVARDAKTPAAGTATATN